MPANQSQLPLASTRYSNQALFSDHYLDDILRRDAIWQQAIPEAEAFLIWLRGLYTAEKGQLANYKEPQLEDNWFKKILERLGHTWEGQASIPGWRGNIKKPDFVFFPDEKTRKTAVSLQNSTNYTNAAIAIGEVKQWEISLDNKKQGAARFDDQNPMYQIDSYLSLTSLEWGILSNGRYWRLLHKSSSRTLETYFEIDLLNVLEAVDEDKALRIAAYFWLFFSQASFLPDAHGRIFLNDALDKSRTYARELEKDLRDNAYRALEQLILGFFVANPGLDQNNPEQLTNVYRNSLYLLYRLLFLFYGESRALLPMSNNTYKTYYSLNQLVDDIKRRRSELDRLPTTGRSYWAKLRELFRLISGVDEQLNADLGVPRYNGSLFDRQKHPFLENHVVGDRYLARAIDYLAVRRVMDSGGKPAYHAVDYRTLDVRQLGSIYEGLLEYKIAIAQEEMVTISKNGVETWVSLAKKGKAKTFGERRQAGELYLTTDKGERKATGSYYTPDYIVEYIVENTLSPIVTQIKEQLDATDEGDRNGRFIAAILNLNILDPAMGSGHFLVEATNYLARVLAVDAEQTSSESELLYWKRRVVEACIYGVDKNPMAVELAKLSLWLKTASADKPLSFLDHHLQHGDSLIGAWLDDLQASPKLDGSSKKRQVSPNQKSLINDSAFTRDVGLAVGGVLAIERATTDTIDDVYLKEKMWEELQNTHIARWRQLADVWVSAYFGNKMSREEYHAIADQLQDRTTLMSATQTAQFLNHPTVMKNDYFHWQLMFPEVFFDEYGRSLQEQAGFDVVIGNPPYGDLLLQDSKNFVIGAGYEAGGSGNNDIFRFFVERGLTILSTEQPLGFIIPNTCLSGKKYANYRKLVSEKARILEILDFKTFKVFEEEVFTHILLIYTLKVDKKYTTTYKAANNGSLTDFNQTQLEVSPKSTDTWLPTGKLLEKLKSNLALLPLSKICDSADVGINYQRHNVGWQNREKSKIAERIFYEGAKQSPNDFQYLKGEDINAYLIEIQSNRWLRHNYAQLLEANETVSVNHEWANKPIKILTRQTGDTIIAVIDTGKHYTGRSLHSTIVTDLNYSPYFIISLLNSNLIDYIYTMLSHEKGRTLAQVKLKNVRKILIPDIDFTSSKSYKTNVLSTFQSHYQQDDYAAILALTTTELDAGRNNTIHDFLAFLAEQMISLNKEKQAKLEAFWLDLEGVTNPADFAILRNKGKQERSLHKRVAAAQPFVRKDSYSRVSLAASLSWNEEAFKGFVKLLVKRVKNLSGIIEVYQTHATAVAALEQQLFDTDDLIDQIVYQLYGLTDEEIAIVESR